MHRRREVDSVAVSGVVGLILACGAFTPSCIRIAELSAFLKCCHDLKSRQRTAAEITDEKRLTANDNKNFR